MLLSAVLRPEIRGVFLLKARPSKEKKMEEKENVAIEKDGAGTRSKKKRRAFKERFTAKRIAFMAVFVALSYAVSWLEIPLPIFGANFLMLDFGNVFIVLISFLLGPLEGVIVCLLKESLRLIGSGSGGAGEIANFLVTSSYILLPSILYQFRRSLKTVVIALPIGCLIATAAALVANRFIVFPVYFGAGAGDAFSGFWIALLVFNLIKTVAVGILTMLLYKRLSNFLKKLKI